MKILRTKCFLNLDNTVGFSFTILHFQTNWEECYQPPDLGVFFQPRMPTISDPTDWQQRKLHTAYSSWWEHGWQNGFPPNILCEYFFFLTHICVSLAALLCCRVLPMLSVHTQFSQHLHKSLVVPCYSMRKQQRMSELGLCTYLAHYIRVLASGQRPSAPLTTTNYPCR